MPNLMRGVILLAFYIILDSFFNGRKFDDLNAKIEKLEDRIKEIEKQLSEK
ncbi:MAG: hypothetical protein JJT76_14680 [Clostridiaceae bacterium]|nr:hypothetical protein [Clostridiaceae bacterium]